ncbi:MULTISPECIES: RadC family protein [Flavobacteriaceae]|uniref:JAB domain-containing protein n=2 Tax=Flavobacteriaceae TaxID=49546 RepID=A0A4Y8AQL7_9FLAO|nr:MULTISPECIES: DNA repair protein RadC [Flavobacteriaceae]TEW73073.1 JAB domain-containing protein [Gramella jeungdoensis]GGK47222.1 DNA repair protein RadC [Lutibacter litoralis]
MNYENKSLTIKSWAEDDRPREKLLLKGKAALSDAELIAILIGSGNRSETAVDVSKKILNSIDNSINKLGKLSVLDLQKFKGIGEAKAISIITALELGRRRRLEQALELPKITSSKAVFNIMQPIIGELQHEEFWIIFLNNSNKVLYKQQSSKGGLTGTLVDVRMVFNKAIELYATAIILCHNHPSGKLQPSNADKLITTKLKKAGETLDIKVLDHLIITENAYFSFADESLM